MERRRFCVAGGAAATGALWLGGLAAAHAQEPYQPGHHELPALPYAYNALDGISEEVVRWHHDRHFAGYVKKRNAIEQKLAAMTPGAADFDAEAFAGLKRAETFNASGMILHGIYWDNLGGDGRPDPALAFVQALTTRFGSADAWQAELRAVALAATGWALCCYDPSDGQLHNYLCDSHHEGAVWGTGVIVALDVFEHAYYRDYGPERAGYLDAFFRNLHWGRLDVRYRHLAGV